MPNTSNSLGMMGALRLQEAILNNLLVCPYHSHQCYDWLQLCANHASEVHVAFSVSMEVCNKLRDQLYEVQQERDTATEVIEAENQRIASAMPFMFASQEVKHAKSELEILHHELQEQQHMGSKWQEVSELCTKEAVIEHEGASEFFMSIHVYNLAREGSMIIPSL